MSSRLRRANRKVATLVLVIKKVELAYKQRLVNAKTAKRNLTLQRDMTTRVEKIIILRLNQCALKAMSDKGLINKHTGVRHGHQAA